MVTFSSNMTARIQADTSLPLSAGERPANFSSAPMIFSGLMVLGPEEGWELARREDLAVLFLVRDGTEFRELMTPAFEALTR